MTIRRDGTPDKPWCLYSEQTGEKIACHATEDEAKAQERAIQRVDRFDRGRTGRIDRTPQGGVRVDAVLTRVGVFPYRNSDGTERREYRPPDEVMKADSVRTLAGAPVTRDHVGMVDPKNWRQVSRGHVLGEPRSDDNRLEATLDVQDAELAEEVLGKKVREVSCGYRCRLDWTPGETPDGQKYDAVQRDITYNHVALGPRGWGRQGRDVALRLDSGAAVMQDQDSDAPEAGAGDEEAMKVTVDGIEYEAGSKSHLDAVEKQRARLEQEKTDAAARADKAEGERDELKKERDQLKERTDKLDEEIEQKVQERAKIREDARKVLGDKAEIPAKPREAMEAAVKHDSKDVDLSDKSDDYVRARFDAAVERAGAGKTPAPVGSTIDDFRKVADRQDKKPEDEGRKDAREEFQKKNRELWKQPLAASAEDLKK